MQASGENGRVLGESAAGAMGGGGMGGQNSTGSWAWQQTGGLGGAGGFGFYTAAVTGGSTVAYNVGAGGAGGEPRYGLRARPRRSGGRRQAGRIPRHIFLESFRAKKVSDISSKSLRRSPGQISSRFTFCCLGSMTV